MSWVTLVLAPPALLAAVRGDVEVVAWPRPPADGPRGDPYRLRTRTTALIAAAEEARGGAGSVGHVLLVVPRRRGVAATTPGVVVDAGDRRVPVGVVFADRAEQLPAWLGGGPAPGPVLGPAPGPVIGAMGTNRFLDPAGRWVARLAQAGCDPHDHRACHTDRSGFADVLAQGPDLAVYLGHGHHLGFGGYHELRFEHLPAQQRAVGVLIALACSTLAQPAGRAGFGTRLVAEGRARTVIGAVRPCRIDELTALGDALIDRLTARGVGRGPASGDGADEPLTIGGALVELLALAAHGDRPELERALAAIRIVGDPASPVSSTSGIATRCVPLSCA